MTTSERWPLVRGRSKYIDSSSKDLWPNQRAWPLLRVATKHAKRGSTEFEHRECTSTFFPAKSKVCFYMPLVAFQHGTCKCRVKSDGRHINIYFFPFNCETKSSAPLEAGLLNYRQKQYFADNSRVTRDNCLG